eukprot:213983_1
MSLNDLSSIVAAQCDQDDLMDCGQGKWQVITGFNDSLEFVVDPIMGLATCASASAARNESDSTTMVLPIVAVVVCVMILVACGVFVWKAKGKKVVEFTHKSTIADESDDDVLQEEEVEMEVEQTKLTENNGE